MGDLAHPSGSPNGSFSKTLFKSEEFENAGFLCGRSFFPDNQVAGDCCVFNFLRRGVDGKHVVRFQSENAVSDYPPRFL